MCVCVSLLQIDGYFSTHGALTMHNYGCYNSTNTLLHLCSQGECHVGDDGVSGGGGGGSGEAEEGGGGGGGGEPTGNATAGVVVGF